MKAINKLIIYYCALNKKGKFERKIARILKLFTEKISAVDISASCIFPKSVTIPHLVGIVIGSTAVIGENVVIMPNVVLGRKDIIKSKSGKRHPTIGNNVFIGAGAVILGDIKVGDYSVIAANSILTISVPSYSLVTSYNCVRKRSDSLDVKK